MDKLKALYDKLSSDGLYTKSYEDFQTQFSDPSSQQKLYDKLSTDGLYTKSPEDFQTQFFGGEAVKKKRRFGRFFFFWNNKRTSSRHRQERHSRRFGVCIGRYFFGVTIG